MKFLGVYLDSRLSWEGHILGLSKRLSKQMFLLRQLLNEVSRDVLRVAYYSNFHSSLSYAILNWGHSSHSSKVFAQQRKCLRILGILKHRECCRQEFVKQKILTLPGVYILECLMYMKKKTTRV